MAYNARDPRPIRHAPPPGYAGPMQDPNYKRLFSFPRMVEDLLRGFLPGQWLDELDFSTLQKLPTEYVSDELLKRHGDCVWRLRRRRSEWLYLLVLLEFQSTDEPRMALRILTYTSLLYQELVRNDALDAGGRLPPVLPVVLYNGEARWRAALEVGELIAPVGPWLEPYQPSQRYIVVDERHVGVEDLPASNLMAAVLGLERSRTPGDLLRVAGRLVEWLRDSDDDDLKRAFTDWVRQMAEGFVPDDAALPAVQTLEGVRMTLVERVAEWPKQWRQEGREEVVEQLRRAGAKLPPEDADMTLVERVAEWPKQWRQEGREEVVEQLRRAGAKLPPEDADMTLVERVAEWPKQWRQEGREEVVEQLRRAGAKLPPEDADMTLVERVAEWPKQWRQEGREQGMKEGIEQGLAHERALLLRLAASRFGAETAERLSGVLAGIPDPAGLAEVGEWLVRCETGSELLTRVDPAPAGANRRGDRGRSNSRGGSRGDSRED